MSRSAPGEAWDAAETPEQDQTDATQATSSEAARRDSSSWRWSFASAVILSLATLASAWSGYEAARWGSEQAAETRAATSANFAGTRLSQIAERERSSDVLIFAIWVEAALADDQALSTEVERRFRPDFVPAFEAWIANAQPGELPAGSPFDRPEYELKSARLADAALENGFTATQRAQDASQIGDNFVLTSVLYASVLFLAGISTKLTRRRSMALTVGLSGAMFVIATIVMVTLPVNVGF